jgi:ion channel POLLUX/CASTOR
VNSRGRLGRLRKFLRYKFDRYMSRGLPALIGLLVAVSTIFVFIAAIPLVVFLPAPETTGMGPLEVVWQTLMHALDPGTIIGAQSTPFRTVMLIVTFVGLILFAGLIGIISGAFDDKIAQLRKGKSEVIESGHTLIVGWNSKLFQIVEQICIANESRKKSVIVILADREKVEMDELLVPLKRKYRGTKIVARNGVGTNGDALDIVSHQLSKSVVILSPEDDPQPDFWVMKVALALTKRANRKPGPYNIVAELKSRSSLETARLIGEGEANWVVEPDVLARLMVQTSRCTGLTHIVKDLLDFEGDEVYVQRLPELDGLTFREIQSRFSHCAPMGLARRNGVILNPDAGTVLTEDDEVVVLAEDDSTVIVDREGSAGDFRARSRAKTKRPGEKVLILGSNKYLPLILGEMSNLLPRSSTTVVLSAEVIDDDVRVANTEFIRGDSSDRLILSSLDLKKFDHIMILPYRDTMSADRADSITLLTLLQLRRLSEELNCSFNIVSEMLNDANRELAEVSDTSDFVVGDELIGLMMAQIAEEPRLFKVFDDLFQSAGVQIEVEPVESYFSENENLRFVDLCDAALARGETALGLVRRNRNSQDNSRSGVELNPERFTPLALSSGDLVVVLRNS